LDSPEPIGNRPSRNLPLDEFLVVINACDLEGDWVVPKDDVREKLAQEVEQRTGIKSSNLAGASDKSIEALRRWISARPDEFVTQTRTAVDGLCALLIKKKATTFEIAFHNTKLPPNELGHEVLLAIRYVPTA
jgi:hypothetical protein